MGYLNQMEAEETFLSDVYDEVNDMMDEVEDVELAMEMWTREEILEYQIKGYPAWQVAQLIAGEPGF